MAIVSNSNHDIGTVLVKDGSRENSSIYNSSWLLAQNNPRDNNVIDYSSQPLATKLLHINNSSSG